MLGLRLSPLTPPYQVSPALDNFSEVTHACRQERKWEEEVGGEGKGEVAMAKAKARADLGKLYM